MFIPTFRNHRFAKLILRDFLLILQYGFCSIKFSSLQFIWHLPFLYGMCQYIWHCSIYMACVSLYGMFNLYMACVIIYGMCQFIWHVVSLYGMSQFIWHVSVYMACVSLYGMLSVYMACVSKYGICQFIWHVVSLYGMCLTDINWHMQYYWLDHNPKKLGPTFLEAVASHELGLSFTQSVSQSVRVTFQVLSSYFKFKPVLQL